MSFQLTPYAGILLATAIISAIVALLSWQRRSSPGGATLALLMLAVTEWAWASGLETAAVGQSAKVLWSKLEYLGTHSTPVLMLIFAAQYTRRDKWLTRRNVALLWVIPILTVAMAATNEWHGLVWSGFTPGPSGSNLLIYHHGPYFWFALFCVYAYILAASLLLIQTTLHPSVLHRRQGRALLAAAAIPWIGSIIYVSGLSPIPGFNTTPTSFMISGLVLLVSIVRRQLFDLVPVARDTLVENMGDGVLVLDEQCRIVDINPAGQRLLGQTAACVGQYGEKVLGQWPEVTGLCHASTEAQVEFRLDRAAPRYADLRVSPLYDRRGRFTGRLVVLRDITQRYQAEVQLKQANERLQAQLAEIETLQAKLREEAIRDPLTGLFNRRYLWETLPRELSRAARERYPIVLVMIDLDRLKKINDTSGHEAGDLILRALGDLLRAQTRSEDIACRYGGEEFVLVLLGLSPEHAHQRINELRLAFEALRVKHGEDELRATFSAGIAIFSQHGNTDEELLRAADRALYAAKAAGRNCIKVGPPEAHTGLKKISSPTMPG